MEAKEILENVLKSFNGGKNWVKGNYYARRGPNKEEFCLMGGIYKETVPDYNGGIFYGHGGNNQGKEQRQAIVALANEIRRSQKQSPNLDPLRKEDVDIAHHEIVSYNDAARSNWNGVEGKLKRAIKRLS